MSIIFLEGLPRSGKSHDSIKSHLIPAIQKGRKVFGNVKGLNHAKIAEASDLPVEEVELLVVQIAWDDTKRIYELVENDALVLLDELQDFWPSSREKLPPEMIEFITQHGHRGLDIVTMGQAFADIHPMWRRRVDTKYMFNKRDAIGQPNKYNWASYKATQPEKFQKVNSGTAEYDPKIFGCYKSHEDSTTNKSTLLDDRTNVFKRPLFKFVIPAFVVLLIVAVSMMVKFFKGTEPPKPPQAQAQQAVQPVAQPAQVRPGQPVQAVEVLPAGAEVWSKPGGVEEGDFVVNLFKTYRPRLSGLLLGENGKVFGYIDFFDSGMHKQEQLTVDKIQALGWQVAPQEYGLQVVKADKRYIVTAWPLDFPGTMPETVRQSSYISGRSADSL